jgi:hypothetical protein
MLNFPLTPVNVAAFALVIIGADGFLRMLGAPTALHVFGMAVTTLGYVMPYSFGLLPAVISPAALAGLVWYALKLFA